MTTPKLIQSRSSRDVLAAALSAGYFDGIPETLGHALTAGQRTAELRSAVLATQALAPLDVMARIQEEIVAGASPEASDLIAAYLDAYQDATGRDALAHSLVALETNVSNRVDQTLRELAPSMNAALRTRFDSLLARILSAAEPLAGVDLREATGLNPLSSAQRKAIDALATLHPEFFNLRNVQVAVIRVAASKSNAGDSVGGYSVTKVVAHRLHEFSDIATNGAPVEPLDAVDWWLPLVRRDDVWLPTFPELLAAATTPFEAGVQRQAAVTAPRQVSVIDGHRTAPAPLSLAALGRTGWGR